MVGHLVEEAAQLGRNAFNFDRNQAGLIPDETAAPEFRSQATDEGPETDPLNGTFSDDLPSFHRLSSTPPATVSDPPGPGIGTGRAGHSDAEGLPDVVDRRRLGLNPSGFRREGNSAATLPDSLKRSPRGRECYGEESPPGKKARTRRSVGGSAFPSAMEPLFALLPPFHRRQETVSRGAFAPVGETGIRELSTFDGLI
jgi:hypothetical protein